VEASQWDCYAMLGIPLNADQAAIRKAYRDLARRYHPDAGTGSSTEKFQQITTAYETLNHRARRERYHRADHIVLRARLSGGPAVLYQEHPAVFGRQDISPTVVIPGRNGSLSRTRRK